MKQKLALEETIQALNMAMPAQTGDTPSLALNNRLMMQYGSGDDSGVNPVMTITGTSLTMTGSSAPFLGVVTCVTATSTLDNSPITVPSGILMYVMATSQ